MFRGQDAHGNVLELEATVDLSNASKPAGKLHWVAEPESGAAPLKVELRLYDKLFKSPDPMSIKEWRADINPNVRACATGRTDAEGGG